MDSKVNSQARERTQLLMDIACKEVLITALFPGGCRDYLPFESGLYHP